MSASLATTTSSCRTTTTATTNMMGQDGGSPPPSSRCDGRPNDDSRRHPTPPSVTPGQQPPDDTSTSGDADPPANNNKEEDEWLMACRCESENGKTLVTLLSCLQHIAEHPASEAAGTGGGGGGGGGGGATQATTTTTASTRRSSSQRKQKSIQPVTVFCTPSGFTFHVFGPAKQSEASVELQKSMFSQYQVLQDNTNNNDDDHQDDDDWRSGGEFCVNLCTVLNALQLLGPLDNNRISVGLSYNLNHEIFKVELLSQQDNGHHHHHHHHQGGTILCTSAIPGLVAADDPEGDSLSNAFRSAPVAARMMVRSAILRDLMPEWSNVAGASCATVAVSESQGLELAVLGHYGECWVQVPATGDHMVSPLELSDRKKTVTRTYPLHSLLSSMQGLEIAEETCININAEGIMAIQHKTVDPSGKGCSNFVDFIMTCLEDEEEAMEGEEEDASSQVSASQASASQASATATATQASQSTTWRTWNNGQSPSQQHNSPETTATSTTGRRRRRRRASPSQQERPIQTNTTGDDVEQSGSDTEDGGFGTPSERQKRQSLQNRRADSLDDDDEEDNEEELRSSLSVAPLFGTVVHNHQDDNMEHTTSTSPRRRRPRRTLSRPQQQGKRGRARNSGTGTENNASNESSDEDDLDITALPGSPGRGTSRREECSSPELVYGNQP